MIDKLPDQQTVPAFMLCHTELVSESHETKYNVTSSEIPFFGIYYREVLEAKMVLDKFLAYSKHSN